MISNNKNNNNKKTFSGHSARSLISSLALISEPDKRLNKEKKNKKKKNFQIELKKKEAKLFRVYSICILK